GHAIAAMLALAFAAPSAAIEVDNLDGFEQHFGRYAPGGDCGRQPQVVVSRESLSFEGGTALHVATRPDYATHIMGKFYKANSTFFFPYAAEPRPFLLTLNADEKEGVLTLQAYDFDYQGGPRLPDRYRPYIAGSPYLRCR